MRRSPIFLPDDTGYPLIFRLVVHLRYGGRWHRESWLRVVLV